MTFLSKISLLLMAKDLKLQKQLKHLFIYIPFQDEKPCQGQHCSTVAHLSFSFFFLLKSSKGKKKSVLVWFCFFKRVIYIYWQYLMINESATAINLLKTKLFL